MGHPKRCLIVDSDDRARSILADELQALGFHIDSADNGKAALAIAIENRPDIIIAAILMPEMDGFAFCQKIKQDPKLHTIPFVFYTRRYANEQAERFAYMLGVADFIDKALPVNEVIPRIQACLDSSPDEVSPDKSLPVATLSVEQQNFLQAIHLDVLNDKFWQNEKELQRTQQSLQESEERFHNLTDGAIQGIVIQSKQQLVFANKAYASMLGHRSVAELLAQDIESMIAPYERGRVRHYQRACLNGEEVPPQYEYDALRADGSPITLQTIARRVNWQGEAAVQSFVIDVTERKWVQKELEQSREELRELTFHLQRVQEEDRTRIAREIHDQMGQSLTGLKLSLAQLKTSIRQNKLTVEQELTAIIDSVDDLIGGVQRISTELRPALLDHFGLPAACKWQTEQFQKHTGIVCRLLIREQEFEMDKEHSTALFRILQEALTNVARHAQAQSVDIALGKGGGSAILVVADNGKGIDDTNDNQKALELGILGMQERANRLGGNVDIRQRAEGGTRVVVRMPLGSQQWSGYDRRRGGDRRRGDRRLHIPQLPPDGGPEESQNG